MENGFESTNLMLPRKENKNMLHSVQIFIMKFKSTYGRSFSQITLLYFYRYLNYCGNVLKKYFNIKRKTSR